MKSETLIIVVALLIVGILIVKNVSVSGNQSNENITKEENQVVYRYDIEEQNFADINPEISRCSVAGSPIDIVT